MNKGASTPATNAGPPLSWQNAFERLRHGVQWSALGTVINQGSTLIVSVLAANALGREVYGAYAIVLSTVVTLSNIAQLGMSYTATKFVAELRETDKVRAGRVLGLGSLVSVASAALAASVLAVRARTLASEGYKAPHLAPALMVAAGRAFLCGRERVLDWRTLRPRSFRAAGYAGAASGALYVTLCVLGMHLGGLQGLLTGMVLSGLVQCAIFSRSVSVECARQGIQLSATGVRSEWTLLSGFAIPAMMCGASYMGATWAANTLLVRQAGGLSQFALLSAATNFWTALVFFPNIINNVGMAMLNNRRAAGAREECRRIFWATIGINGALLFVGGGILGLWAPEFLRIVRARILRSCDGAESARGGGGLVHLLVLGHAGDVERRRKSPGVLAGGSPVGWHDRRVSDVPRGELGRSRCRRSRFVRMDLWPRSHSSTSVAVRVGAAARERARGPPVVPPPVEFYSPAERLGRLTAKNEEGSHRRLAEGRPAQGSCGVSRAARRPAGSWLLLSSSSRAGVDFLIKGPVLGPEA